MQYNNRKKGGTYEAVAAEYLISCGYNILEQNYRKRSGEIDIIAQKDDVIIFCEVKYRSSNKQGDPLEAVGYRKQLQISKMAAHYMISHGLSSEASIRFDVIGIWGNGKLSHIKNAFEYCYGR